MATQLKITLTNIPDEMMKDLWDKFCPFAKMLNQEVSPTEDITIDFWDAMKLMPDKAIGLIAGSVGIWSTLSGGDKEKQFNPENN